MKAGHSLHQSLSLSLLFISLFLVGCNKQPPIDTKNATSTTANSVQQAIVPLTNMVLIKAGTYLRIKFPVTISHDFWMGKFEVTQAEYEQLTGKNPSHFPGDTNRPVEKVSFNDAVTFCSTLTARERAAGRLTPTWEYRLPTEAEWEYACRAGSTNLFSFGDDSAVADKYAWTIENGETITHPVGQKRPNAWGLYDMHGNVWEWCSDWFAPYPAGLLTDPIGPTEGKYKVFRGGGWNNDVAMARCSNRFMMEPNKGIHFVGFRLALAQARPAIATAR
jgi:formylglycine-generating enzyme required for sulfatase activity